jgi:murein DD-endopeptidase MepM/ murein hydrolase activator NlpD
MKNALLLLLAAVIVSSCNSSFTKNIFRHKTPHETYADHLDDKGLDNTPEGRQWFTASRTALEHPVEMQLPYKIHAFLQPEKPRALGIQFKAKQGQRLTFTINKKAPVVVYADLFRQVSVDEPLFSADTSQSTFSYDIDEPGEYILRLQPELFHIADFTLSVSIGPSLDFPVASAKANAGSYWGDERDAGKRKHEGIDIFAPKRTPVVAVADGIITAVRDGGLGGKTVLLTPEGKHYSLYYAHLDQQLVHEGEAVKKGTVLGLVGNTGNAKNTPSHLHFGVYTYSGAVDPLPFIDRSKKSAAALPEKELISNLRLKKSMKTPGGMEVRSNTIVQPLALTSNGYIVEMANGQPVEVSFNLVEQLASNNNHAVAAKRS